MKSIAARIEAAENFINEGIKEIGKGHNATVIRSQTISVSEKTLTTCPHLSPQRENASEMPGSEQDDSDINEILPIGNVFSRLECFR